LPHDHRTHRNPPPPHPPTGEHGSGVLGDQSRTRHHHHTGPPPEGRHPDQQRHRFLRCSRPLYSSQTTTRTPHTLVVAPLKKGDPPTGRTPGTQSQHPHHHHPSRPPPPTRRRKRRNP